MFQRGEHIARVIVGGDLDRTKELITADNVNALHGRHLRKTPLCYAVTHKRMDIAEWLVSHAGADVNGPSGTTATPIFYARTASMVEFLAKAGADLNYVAPDLVTSDKRSTAPTTPIEHAVSTWTPTIVYALIHHGAVLPSSLRNYDDICDLPLYALRCIQGRELCRSAARTMALCMKRAVGTRDLSSRIGRAVWNTRSDEAWEEACCEITYAEKRVKTTTGL
jgi:hypothetical protein